MGKKQLIMKIIQTGAATTDNIRDELALQGIKCDLVLIETNSKTAYCYSSLPEAVAA